MPVNPAMLNLAMQSTQLEFKKRDNDNTRSLYKGWLDGKEAFQDAAKLSQSPGGGGQ